MKRNKKKGFTIVELVIVIAVIAILAAVMIPTFGGMVAKANESAALQAATNTYKALLLEEPYNGDLDLNATADAADLYIKVTQANKDYYYQVINGNITLSDLEDDPDAPTADATGYKALENADYTNVFVFADKELPAADVEPEPDVNPEG